MSRPVGATEVAGCVPSRRTGAMVTGKALCHRMGHAPTNLTGSVGAR